MGKEFHFGVQGKKKSFFVFYTPVSGGAVRKDRILPFDKKSAESIVKMTKFKSGHHSIKEFKKACEKFGLVI